MLLQTAAHTRAELTDEVDRLLLAQPDGWLTGARVREDGQGIEFTTTGADLLAGGRSGCGTGVPVPGQRRVRGASPAGVSPSGTCAT